MTAPNFWWKDGGLLFKGGKPRSCPTCPCDGGETFPGGRCSYCVELGSPTTIFVDIPPNYAGLDPVCNAVYNADFAGRFALTGGGCGWRYSYPGMYEGLAWDLNIGIEGGVVTWFLNLGPLAVTFCGWNFVVFKLPIGPPPITCFDLGSGLSLPWVSTNPNGRLCMGCGYEDLVYAPGNALVTLT